MTQSDFCPFGLLITCTLACVGEDQSYSKPAVNKTKVLSVLIKANEVYGTWETNWTRLGEGLFFLPGLASADLCGDLDGIRTNRGAGMTGLFNISSLSGTT